MSDQPTPTGVVGTHYRLTGSYDGDNSTVGASILVFDGTLSGDDKWLPIGSIFRDDDGRYAVYGGDGHLETTGDDPRELVEGRVRRWTERMRS